VKPPPTAEYFSQWFANVKQNVKSFPSSSQGGADLRFVSLQPHTSETTDARLVHRTVCLFTCQHSPLVLTAPRRDGQAELTWVGGYTPRWFTRLPTVTHPSTGPVEISYMVSSPGTYIGEDHGYVELTISKKGQGTAFYARQQELL